MLTNLNLNFYSVKRSFPRQLSMEYLDCPSIRIYIHDVSKDMFYELEDLRDVRDRCVLRIYEHGVNGPQPVGGPASLPTPWNDSEQFGYFSEPEFESDYQSQHVHRTKRVSGQLPTSGGQSQYYGTIILPAQYRSQTMAPRNYTPAGSGQPPQPPERSKPYPGLTLFLFSWDLNLTSNNFLIQLLKNLNQIRSCNVFFFSCNLIQLFIVNKRLFANSSKRCTYNVTLRECN